MDKQLRLLDSFPARGADGSTYKVMAYEHLRRVDLSSAGLEQWEPTGLTNTASPAASGSISRRRRLAGRADRPDLARRLSGAGPAVAGAARSWARTGGMDLAVGRR